MAAHGTLDRRRSWRCWERELGDKRSKKGDYEFSKTIWSKFCIQTQRVFTLIFGAVAFENSWASDHRRHHKHVDHDEDPYDISKGFFHAHMGWLLFKLWPQPPLDNVNDLKKDPLVMWQHRHIHIIAVVVSFVLPTLAGFVWDAGVGALGGFLIGGVAKVVVLQHGTFHMGHS